MSTATVAVNGNLALATGRATNRRWMTWGPILLSDIFALALAGTGSVFLRHLGSSQGTPADYLPFVPCLGLFVLMFGLVGLYPGIAQHPVQELRSVASAVTGSYLILLASTFLLHISSDYSRIIFLAAWLASIVLVVAFRNLLRGVLGRRVWWGMPAVVLGTGPRAIATTEMLRKNSSLGLKVIAMLDGGEGVEDWKNLPAPVMGNIDLAPTLADVFGVRYAIVSLQGIRGTEFAESLARYTHSFDHVLLIPDFLNVSSLWVSAKDLGGILGLELTQTLIRPGPQFFKRGVDVAVALFGGVLILPILFAVYVAIRLTSRGNPLYSQERIGKNRSPFRAWKFRTMVPDADRVLKDCLDRDPELRKEWEQNQKLRKDPRVTTIGRILRKTSLDELPQIWNILRGDMSLVGPRPIVENEIRRYGCDFDLYRKVRPGITGLWQVSGRNHTSYDERVQYDSYYVRNWSVWMDLYILGCTVRTVLAGEGAY